MILNIDSVQGQVRIGSPPVLLPGILSTIEIGGELLIDNAPVEGKSGSAKQVHGWGDAAVSISLILIDNPAAGKTRFDYLAAIVKIFKQVKDGNPLVYSLQHPMAAAWSIKQLLFLKVRSSLDKSKAIITVSLDFTEHNPVVGISQERQDNTKTAQANTAGSSTKDAALTATEGKIDPVVKLNIKKTEDKFYAGF